MADPDPDVSTFALTPAEAFITGVQWEPPVLRLRRATSRSFFLAWGVVVYGGISAVTVFLAVRRTPWWLIVAVPFLVLLLGQMLGYRLAVTARPDGMAVQGRVRRRTVAWAEVADIDLDEITVRPVDRKQGLRGALLDLKLYGATGTAVPVVRLDDGSELRLWGLGTNTGPLSVLPEGPSPVEVKATLLARYQGLVTGREPTYRFTPRSQASGS